MSDPFESQDLPVSDNPYAAPAAQIDTPVSGTAEELELASRWHRFVAQFVNGLVVLLAYIPLILGIFIGEAAGAPEAGTIIGVLGLIIGLIWILSIHIRLLRENGQSIGKRTMGIKIVRTNGEKPDLSRLIIYRYLFLGAVNVIISLVALATDPSVNLLGSLLGLVNILMIFSASRQCLHDKIADTLVVRA